MEAVASSNDERALHAGRATRDPLCFELEAVPERHKGPSSETSRRVLAREQPVSAK